MICIDEFGPLEIRPQLGSNWRPLGKPDRVPATYRRLHGVRYLFAAYDVQADLLYGHVKHRKRTLEFLSFLKAVRRWYPAGVRLYIVLDNLNTHRHQDVKQWAEKNNVELVYTPTYSSWLNRIECHFGPLRKFAITNSNYADHLIQNKAIQRYITWRNANRRDPKVLREQKKVKVL